MGLNTLKYRFLLGRISHPIETWIECDASNWEPRIEGRMMHDAQSSHTYQSERNFSYPGYGQVSDRWLQKITRVWTSLSEPSRRPLRNCNFTIDISSSRVLEMLENSFQHDLTSSRMYFRILDLTITVVQATSAKRSRMMCRRLYLLIELITV